MSEWEALRNAQRTGGQVISEKKTGINQKKAIDGSLAAKIDRENDTFELPKVQASVSKTISKARLALNMTQKDFAVKINEKPQVVNDYESGKTVPNQQILAKMERVLNVKLRGKDIGEPLRKK